MWKFKKEMVSCWFQVIVVRDVRDWMHLEVSFMCLCRSRQYPSPLSSFPSLSYPALRVTHQQVAEPCKHAAPHRYRTEYSLSAPGCFRSQCRHDRRPLRPPPTTYTLKRRVHEVGWNLSNSLASGGLYRDVTTTPPTTWQQHVDVVIALPAV